MLNLYLKSLIQNIVKVLQPGGSLFWNYLVLYRRKNNLFEMKQRRLTDYSVFKDTGTEMIQLIQPGSDLQKAYALQPNVCKSKNWKGRIDIKMRWQKSVFDYNWHLFYPGVNICPKKSETVSPQIWVFWNCLSWSTRKSSKLSIEIFLKLCIKIYRNKSIFFKQCWRISSTRIELAT